MLRKVEYVNDLNDITRENTDGLFAVPGQMFIVRLPHPIEEGVVFETPVVVTGVCEQEFGPSCYTVDFFTRWPSGERSGTITINDFPLWRYVSDRLPTEEEVKLFEYVGEDLHYREPGYQIVRGKSKTFEVPYVYPFAENDTGDNVDG